ncbi:hypothetical protein Tco_0913495, partial [Tanacetum coccineum]
MRKFLKICLQQIIKVAFSSHTDLTSPEVINPSSGNPTSILEPVTKSSSSPALISLEESELIWEEFEAYLASDSFPPGNDDLVDIIPEEFTDELALITFPPGNDDMTPEDVIKEIECLLNQSPLADYSPSNDLVDTIPEEFTDELSLITFPLGNDDMTPEDVIKEIECLLNQSPLADYSPSNDLVNTIPEMFADKHALDYSSPPLWDYYDDELFDHETVNDYVYDDPFDFKEVKIKDSKILIDELDFPKSSDFLPFPECDLVLYEDFSEVDALPSTNNEDKVFNLGILIH